MVLYTGPDEFTNFPSVQECDRQISGIMRTACLTPATKAKELAELLDSGGPWPVFADNSLILWRKPAPMASEMEEEPSAVEPGSGKWCPGVLPSKYDSR